MERLTEYMFPKGGTCIKYPCFSPDIIPDDNCPPFFCEKAKQCDLVHINSRKCPYLQVIDRLAAYEDIMPIERAQELAQAEKNGRLMVLPCKVGDTVYEANKRGFVSTYEVISIHVSAWSVLVGWNLIDGIYSNLNGFEVSALGKTVFLTREEAEAALKKREEADNETD